MTERMIELLRTLKRQMNGAVSEAMERGGIHYGLNYGVSLPTIKEIAKRYAPDNDFARFLYVKEVRELRICALYIYDASAVSEGDIEFLAKGITNSEMAELTAFILLKHSPLANDIAKIWSNSQDRNLCYCSTMLLKHIAR